MRQHLTPAAIAAAEADRRFFALHPGASSYRRPALADELPGAVAGEPVEVTQLAPGVRVRHISRTGRPSALVAFLQRQGATR